MNIGEDFIDVTFVGKTTGNSGTDTSTFSVFTRFPKHTCPYTFQAYMGQKMKLTDSIEFEEVKLYKSYLTQSKGCIHDLPMGIGAEIDLHWTVPVLWCGALPDLFTPTSIPHPFLSVTNL